MKAGINGYPVRRAQCKTTGQIHDFVGEMALTKPDSTEFELILVHRNNKTGALHVTRKDEVVKSFWPMGYVDDDWPEDNYDWPQTASTVQGGVVKDGDIKLTKDEILFLLKEVKRLGSEVEQIRHFALDVARHWYDGDWNDEQKTVALINKLWESVAVFGAADAGTGRSE